jgi:hypothetical protein
VVASPLLVGHENDRLEALSPLLVSILWKRILSNDKYHFAYFVTPTLKSFLVFLTEENPQRSQTSTIAFD